MSVPIHVAISVYRAAEGERVVVRGCEPVTGWTRQAGGVWQVELPDAMFGDFHPYRLRLSGDWLHDGKELHLGCVYQNGESLRELAAPAEVAARVGSYWVEEHPGSVVLHVNFGGADPNRELVEVNVRECVFFPVVSGLKYVTVDGLWIEHAAANWAAWRCAQRGALGTGQGFESPDGSPLTLDRDFLGEVRDAAHPAAGPFESVAKTGVVPIRVGPKSAPAAQEEGKTRKAKQGGA
ncbi:MAG: hypothetical protein K9N23_03135 [Akkermansiaceae bacterium]|nr:hypothetical protein [Akkermansiaceae bacterium]